MTGKEEAVDKISDQQGFVEHKGKDVDVVATTNKAEDGEMGVEIDAEKSAEILLWEEEVAVRKQVADSPVTGNFMGAFCVNTYAAIHIFVVYLISLESLLSIGLSVGMTVCK